METFFSWIENVREFITTSFEEHGEMKKQQMHRMVDAEEKGNTDEVVNIAENL